MIQHNLPAGAVRSRPSVSHGPLRPGRGSFALGTGRSPRRQPHVPCMWKRRRVDPRLVQVQVRPPAGAVRSRSSVSHGPLRRGSFALGTGRSPRRKPHVPCMWKRLAGRPTAGAGPSPPTSRRSGCDAPSFCIGRSLAPWIIRTRHGPQPEEIAACALHVEAAGGSTHGWRRPKSTHHSLAVSRRCNAPSFCIGRALAPWIIRTRHAAARGESRTCLACGSGWRVDPRVTHGWCRPKSAHQQAL